MNKIKITLSFLLLSTIILGSIVLILVQEKKSAQLPYSIGATVLSSSELPPGMTLKEFQVQKNEVTPTIKLVATEDSMGGWNIHAITSNFSFAPEHLGGEPFAGEGHVHLYIDDKLIIMLGPWYHIDSLSVGSHTIKIELFNNDHSTYTVEGSYIKDQQTVNIIDKKMNM